MLRVDSEIGRLRAVLVHEPGPEVERMVPSMMEELLFDDILFAEAARQEHRRLRRLLHLLDVEVLEARDLLEEALAVPGALRWTLEAVCPELPPAVRAELRELPPERLAAVLVEGILAPETGSGTPAEALYRLPPLPNWCFQRDPQVVVGAGVIPAAMATSARWREALLARVLFRFHPRLAPEWTVDVLEPPRDRPLYLGLHRPRLEGGDVLVASPEVLVVGVSERTNAVAVEALARALAGREEGPRHLVVVQLPARRAFMHLDTVFTIVDRDAALVHPQVILASGAQPAEVTELDLAEPEPIPRPRPGLLEALAAHGLELEPIPCGGDDPIAQRREQWTDGANALALAPGVILLYDRNVRTAEALAARGFRVVTADDVLLGREELDLAAGGRACVLLPSHEISRARGGPHCLTHPLLRDPL